MRKTIISEQPVPKADPELAYINVEQLAQVQVSSENADYPIEAALLDVMASGWLAADAGSQTIRLIFDEPITIKQIFLEIEELQQSRTQEFVLSWLKTGEATMREILRQQFCFSPPTTTKQSEQYALNLEQLLELELIIIPDISQGHAYAKLKTLRLG
ncbi:MAG: carbohydrate-binding protein [Methylococcales bacterium]